MITFPRNLEAPALVHLRGRPGDMGAIHGRMLAGMIDDVFEPYLAEMRRLTKVDDATLRARCAAWLPGLPAHVQEEIDGMATGAGRSTEEIALFLFADIAGQSPLCSGLTLESGSDVWAARNCDWWRATLMRGTSVVVHETPGRIPCLGVGINGDIDVDTGANAAGLWMHVHTLWTNDEPTPDKRRLSWLFWLREALETCASIAEVERYIETVERDRGVILFVADGPGRETAIYECGRSTWRRVAAEGPVQAATNHCRHKHPDPERAARSKPGSTTARMERLRLLLEGAAGAPTPPGDLMGLLADREVEMWRPSDLTTIYSAVCAPGRGELWFSSGATPAASRGTWRRIAWPW